MLNVRAGNIRFLAKASVKEEIINFDARKIPPDVNKKVAALIKSKESSFNPKNAKRASAAAAPLAAWVRANLDYSTIVGRVAPLEEEKSTLIRNLNKAEKQMEKLSKGLETVDERVAELKQNFESLMKEATQIKIDLDKEEASLKIELQLEKGSLLSAAFVTFLGSESEQKRDEIFKKWKSLLNLDDFNVLEFNIPEIER
ncbi:unnamed protein product, partial [Gongylonema pulchrum]|uniref:MT domain-containing protein n=1 Tax=Gongylonema pulchrum TaxID=637853 RepID=A0A183DEZ6_9BILA